MRLLNRNTRGVSMTEAGALYYEKCKIIVNDVAEAENVVKVRQTHVQGQLRIGSSVAFGRRVLIPLAMEFMKQNPQVQVDLSFEDRYTDLVANGIDVALRLGKLADSSLGARMLGINPWVLVASNTYLRKHGTPRRPSDLKEHSTLIYSSVQGNDIWRLRNASGEPVSIPVTGGCAPTISALLAAARSHMGIAALPRYVAHDSLKDGRVVEVLKTCRLHEQEIHAVYPSPRLVPQKCSPLSLFCRASLTMPGGKTCHGWVKPFPESLRLAASRLGGPAFPLCTRHALAEGTTACAGAALARCPWLERASITGRR